MCFDHDSRPPIPPIAGAAVDGNLVELVSEDGTPFMAFHARAAKPIGAGMLILPDVRGLHRYYEELALRFAEAGIDAVAVDYFGRTAPGEDRGSDFDYQPHVGQLRWDTMLSDFSAGLHELREDNVSAVFSVGFCMGGRVSFDLATRPDFDMAGVIGFYGWPVGDHRSGSPAPADHAADMKGRAVLGLFGGADQGIKPEMVSEFDSKLSAAGVEHEIVTYPGAPHSFFDRKMDEFAAESADAWRRVLDFVSRHTPAAEAAG